MFSATYAVCEEKSIHACMLFGARSSYLGAVTDAESEPSRKKPRRASTVAICLTA